jgi:hypothetical protein
MCPIIETEIMKTRTAEAHGRGDQARLALPRVLPGPRPWPVAHRPAI